MRCADRPFFRQDPPAIRRGDLTRGFPCSPIRLAHDFILCPPASAITTPQGIKDRRPPSNPVRWIRPLILCFLVLWFFLPLAFSPGGSFIHRKGGQARQSKVSNSGLDNSHRPRQGAQLRSVPFYFLGELFRTGRPNSSIPARVGLEATANDKPPSAIQTSPVNQPRSLDVPLTPPPPAPPPKVSHKHQ